MILIMRHLKFGLACISAIVFIWFYPHIAQADGGHTSPFTATYTITFDADWTADDHQGGVPLPSGPHFSPLIGGVHNDSVEFWAADGVTLATSGIEDMAEFGGTSALRNEVTAQINKVPPAALSVMNGSGVSNIGSTTIDSVMLNQDFPLISLVSMIAPSHDWFVGVAGLSMLDNQGQWKDVVQVPLYPYDAGTEEGNDFSTSGSATDPPDPIADIRGVPPFNTNDLGTFTFTRIKVTNLSLDKTVEPKINVMPQSALTYTISIFNNGDFFVNNATLTDTLPSTLAFAQWVDQPAAATESNGTISWAGAVPTGTQIIFTYVATYVGSILGESVTNTAQLSYSTSTITKSDQASASFVAFTGTFEPEKYLIYIPLLLKS